MGPSLSDSVFVHGSDPANIYLTIAQGRSAGMPAWGGMLPDTVIWDLVAYVLSISKEPRPSWGTTMSQATLTTEQVPTEYATTPDPWSRTETFSAGKKPNSTK